MEKISGGSIECKSMDGMAKALDDQPISYSIEVDMIIEDGTFAVVNTGDSISGCDMDIITEKDVDRIEIHCLKEIDNMRVKTKKLMAALRWGVAAFKDGKIEKTDTSGNP